LLLLLLLLLLLCACLFGVSVFCSLLSFLPCVAVIWGGAAVANTLIVATTVATSMPSCLVRVAVRRRSIDFGRGLLWTRWCSGLPIDSGQRYLASPAVAAACSSQSKVVSGSLRFDELSLSSSTLRALTEIFRYEEMTSVQADVLPMLLRAEPPRIPDAVIHARTGTGKTLTYLIPAVERIVRRPPPGVGCLIVAPSRELALQIAREAELLCTYHAIQVAPLIGGVRRDRDEAMIRRRRPAIIVGTAGRLVEHLESTFRFQTLFEAIDLFVLDEVDRLLEGENAEAIRDLLGYLPRQGKHRSLLLSATMPSEVRDLAARMCGDFELLDLVGDSPTAEEGLLDQMYACCPGILLMVALRNAVEEEIIARPKNHKVIVFFPTARLAAFASHLFRDQLQVRLFELHGRCDGAARIVTQHDFAASPSGILFTAGASERGMDYADVSLVIQVCSPATREQYIHRVGRTARNGKSGRALLLVLDKEVSAGCLNCIDDLLLRRHPEEARLLNDEGEIFMHATSSVDWASKGPLPSGASAAFASLLAHYHGLALLSGEMVAAVGEILLGCGASEPPPISRRLAEELGLAQSTQVRIGSADERGGVIEPAVGRQPGPRPWGQMRSRGRDSRR